MFVRNCYSIGFTTKCTVLAVLLCFIVIINRWFLEFNFRYVHGSRTFLLFTTRDVVVLSSSFWTSSGRTVGPSTGEVSPYQFSDFRVKKESKRGGFVHDNEQCKTRQCYEQTDFCPVRFEHRIKVSVVVLSMIIYSARQDKMMLWWNRIMSCEIWVMKISMMLACTIMYTLRQDNVMKKHNSMSESGKLKCV